MKSDASLALHIYASEHGWPLRVEVASVQWVGGQTFGLAFAGSRMRKRSGWEKWLQL